MLDFLFNRRKYDVKKFYDWHSSYHKWMNSIARADLPTLEKELEAIQLTKKQCIGNEFGEYELEMLGAQEAIVMRIIKEIELGRGLK